MNLLIDIGNSRVKWAQQTSRGLQSCDACHYEKDNVTGSLRPYLNDLTRPDQIYVSNVAGKQVASDLSTCLESEWSISPEYMVVTGEEAGVINGYEDMNQLGIDRWLAMIAAWNTYRKSVCIVDCGTALTVDVVAASGHHKGGYIVAGKDLMVDALINRTMQINSRAAGIASLELGRSTVECISNGALAAIAALVESVFEVVKHEQGSDSRCIITGGNGEETRRLISADIDFDPHLVLKGIDTLTGNPG